jgi:hypothetical protein
MKTLDELIQCITERIKDFNENGCFNCHYCDCNYDCSKSCILEDIKYCLESIPVTEDLYHDAIKELSEYITQKWKDKSLPLTWEELQQMNGKPVWLTVNQKPIKHNGWAICKIVSDYTVEFVVLPTKDEFFTKFSLIKSYYYNTWEAYKEERM